MAAGPEQARVLPLGAGEWSQLGGGGVVGCELVALRAGPSRGLRSGGSPSIDMLRVLRKF